jgi:hypothetical protein
VDIIFLLVGSAKFFDASVDVYIGPDKYIAGNFVITAAFKIGVSPSC